MPVYEIYKICFFILKKEEDLSCDNGPVPVYITSFGLLFCLFFINRDGNLGFFGGGCQRQGDVGITMLLSNPLIWCLTPLNYPIAKWLYSPIFIPYACLSLNLHSTWIKVQVEFLSHTGHISNAHSHMWPVASVTQQYNYRTCLSSPKVLLDV